MPDLILHNRKVESIFNLLGEKENDITYSLGWALSRSPKFLEAFLKTALRAKGRVDLSEAVITMQEHGKDSGYTDLEIRSPLFHIIAEAKRGWELPGQPQLEKYMPRFQQSKAKQAVIVTMSECSSKYASLNLPSVLSGVPIIHISWRDISALTEIRDGSHSEKRLMGELRNYITTFVNMQNQQSNLVYVVSLSHEEWVPGLTYIQVVDERHRYFHPYGSGGWPIEPPNYIAFRYNGMLQSIHHIEKADVIENFHPYFKEATNASGDKYFLYELGPAIRPTKVIRTGKIYRNGRVWAMLDLLLTSDTISEARDKTDKRNGAV